MAAAPRAARRRRTPACPTLPLTVTPAAAASPRWAACTLLVAATPLGAPCPLASVTPLSLPPPPSFPRFSLSCSAPAAPGSPLGRGAACLSSRRGAPPAARSVSLLPPPSSSTDVARCRPPHRQGEAGGLPALAGRPAFRRVSPPPSCVPALHFVFHVVCPIPPSPARSCGVAGGGGGEEKAGGPTHAYTLTDTGRRGCCCRAAWRAAADGAGGGRAVRLRERCDARAGGGDALDVPLLSG